MIFIVLPLLLSMAAARSVAVGRDQNANHVGRLVGTTSGFVTGHPAPNASQVSEYLGIPYAKPPVGALRFAAPVAYVNPHGTLDGSNFVRVPPKYSPNFFPLRGNEKETMTD
jgi:cholinesterase